MLKGNTDKLEPRTEVCIFIGYPRGTKGGLFYNPKDQKIIVSTNARFLEEDYVMNHKPKGRIVLEELREERPIQTFPPPITQEETLKDGELGVPLPRRSGRIAKSQANDTLGETINMMGDKPDLYVGDGTPGFVLALRDTTHTQT